MKAVAFLLCLLTICAVSAGCAQQNTNETTAPSISTEPATEAVITEPARDNLSFVPFKEYNLEEDVEVKNIILMIGDGMGENIIENAEIVKGDKLAMRAMPNKCYVTTDSLDGTTDSAASSTALSCGVKTHNQYIGVDENKQAVEALKAPIFEEKIVDHIIGKANVEEKIVSVEELYNFNEETPKAKKTTKKPAAKKTTTKKTNKK